MFALKVLRKDNIIKRNQVEHTKTERNVLGYVKHPFIVGLNMAFQTKEKLYFVLDYCAGGEVRNITLNHDKPLKHYKIAVENANLRLVF